MSRENSFKVDERLVNAWQRTLPTTLGEGDRASVRSDESDASAVRISISSAGRTGYTFDFKCSYKDEREVHVELIDVEKDNQHVDERTDIIQNLTEDYIRHIHECTQILHEVTNTKG